MNLKRMVYASTTAVGIGAAALFGLGGATANADPGPCGGPGPQNCQGPHDGWNNGRDNGWNGGPVDWQHRNIDQARRDHQPFNWNGQWVQPMPAGNGVGWGFWFLGQWIPL